MSFRTRVALLVAAVVAVVVAGVAGSFLYLARGKALETLDEKLVSRAKAVAQLGEVAPDIRRSSESPTVRIVWSVFTR